MNLSQIRSNILNLKKKRDIIETKIIKIRSKMIKGSISEKFIACKKPNCKCNKGQLHGPFLYLSQKINNKTKNQPVDKITNRATNN